MKKITKNTSPTLFEDWKIRHNQYLSNNTPNQVFKKFRRSSHRERVKKSLLVEQGYICCYCGKRVELDELTSIEHLFPKNTPLYSARVLDYNNLLASCNGGRQERETNPNYSETCDAKKDEDIINITPLNYNCELWFKYKINGEVEGINTNSINTISTLGLDCDELTEIRKEEIEKIIYNENDESRSIEEIETELLDISKKTGYKYNEFFFQITKAITPYINLRRQLEKDEDIK